MTTKTVEHATQIHPITGQEIADLGPVAVRPVTKAEWRKYVDLAGVGGRNLYISVEDTATGTNGGYLIASHE